MKKSTLLAYLFYSLVNYLAFFVVIPLFTPEILDPSSPYRDPLNLIVDPTTLLGVVLGIYGLGLFSGSLVLGRWSDRFGKKWALKITMILFILGNLGVGYFFSIENVWMLVFFRFVTGLGSSGAQLLYNAIDDLESDQKKKVRAIGYLVGVSLFATVAGPVFGPFFVGNQGFFLGTPFYLLALMGGASLLFLEKTWPKKSEEAKALDDNLITILSNPKILFLAATFFLMILNIESLFIAIPILMVMAFQVTHSWIALFFAYGGLVAVLTGSLIIPWVGRFFSLRLAYFFSFIGLIFATLAFLLASTPEEVFVPFTLFAIFGSIALFNGNELALALVEKKNSGAVRGVLGSLIAIAIFASSLLMGYSASINLLLPILAMALMAVLGTFLTLAGFHLFKATKGN
ncbi:MAG: MFS transporter [Chlamydiae bacterium]|nr:MFS transporter [Chlamydiota bacterium]